MGRLAIVAKVDENFDAIPNRVLHSVTAANDFAVRAAGSRRCSSTRTVVAPACAFENLKKRKSVDEPIGHWHA